MKGPLLAPTAPDTPFQALQVLVDLYRLLQTPDEVLVVVGKGCSLIMIALCIRVGGIFLHCLSLFHARCHQRLHA